MIWGLERIVIRNIPQGIYQPVCISEASAELGKPSFSRLDFGSEDRRCSGPWWAGRANIQSSIEFFPSISMIRPRVVDLTFISPVFNVCQVRNWICFLSVCCICGGFGINLSSTSKPDDASEALQRKSPPRFEGTSATTLKRRRMALGWQQGHPNPLFAYNPISKFQSPRTCLKATVKQEEKSGVSRWVPCRPAAETVTCKKIRGTDWH